VPQDQLFKELLRAFLREFLDLFYPDISAQLDFGQVVFLDKKTFTDVPEGSRREADIVARVRTRDTGRSEIILIHVEVQTQRRAEFAYRMFEYYVLLRLRHRQPVFPVAVYLAPGGAGGGLNDETYSENLFGSEIVSFRYKTVSLPNLPSDPDRPHTGAFAAALSALMRPGAAGRAEQKRRALRGVLQSDVDEARKSLLLYLIETYLPLDPSEQSEFEALTAQEASVLQQDEETAMKPLPTTIEEVYKRVAEDRSMLNGKRAALLRQVHLKFGDVPPDLAEKIAAARFEEELDPLLDRVLTATVPGDLLEAAP